MSTEPTTPSSPAAPLPDRIQLKRWDVVCDWNYLNSTDNCTICHNAMTDQCLQCYKGVSEGDCVPVWGKCSHIFHLHCLQKWIAKQSTCPICHQAWVTQASQ